MKRLSSGEWYGTTATLLKRSNDYSLISYQCNGTGICMDYPLFPGINLVFMDFNCKDTFSEPIPNRDILDIRHYQQGRVEFELQNQRVFHMGEDEFCINALSNTPASYSFPFGRCSGVSFVIDRGSIDEATMCQMLLYGIDVEAIGKDLELDLHWYVCKTPAQLSHIFTELYAAKGKEPLPYFRIKSLELLYQVQKLRNEDLEIRLPLEELVSHANISMVTFQAIFKQIYGDTPYAHLKKYKMN